MLKMKLTDPKQIYYLWKNTKLKYSNLIVKIHKIFQFTWQIQTVNKYIIIIHMYDYIQKQQNIFN